MFGGNLYLAENLFYNTILLFTFVVSYIRTYCHILRLSSFCNYSQHRSLPFAPKCILY